MKTKTKAFFVTTIVVIIGACILLFANGSSGLLRLTDIIKALTVDTTSISESIECNLQSGGKLKLKVIDVNIYDSVYNSGIDTSKALTLRDLNENQIFVKVKLKISCISKPEILFETDDGTFNVSFLNILAKSKLESSYIPDSIWYFDASSGGGISNQYYYHLLMNEGEEREIELGFVADKACQKPGEMLLEIKAFDSNNRTKNQYIILN